MLYSTTARYHTSIAHLVSWNFSSSSSKRLCRTLQYFQLSSSSSNKVRMEED